MRIVFIFIFCGVFIQAFSQNIQIMTFNIRYDNKGDGENTWDNRKKETAEMINYYHPDIFGLQEALSQQSDYIHDNLSDYSMFALGREANNKGEACPVFYNKLRFELIENKTFWLSEKTDSVSVGWDAALPRICTYGIFKDKTTGRKLFVFNAHFDHIGKMARQESAKLILKKIAEITDKKDQVVFMGDLNNTPESETIQILSKGLTDGLTTSKKEFYGPIGSWNAFDKTLLITERIDYIFVKNLNVLKYRHIDDKMRNGNFLSDHYPVIIELESSATKGNE